MVFLKKHSWSSVGFNFVLTAFAIQWTVLCIGFWEHVLCHDKDAYIDPETKEEIIPAEKCYADGHNIKVLFFNKNEGRCFHAHER